MDPEIIKFFCPSDFATPEMLAAVHHLGFDRSMTPVSAKLEGNELWLECPPSENLRFCIPWTIPNVGNKMLTTGTLLASEDPYYLSIELARGLCVSIRNQAADWEVLGLLPSNEFQEMILNAGEYLFRAIKLSHCGKTYDPEVDRYANCAMHLCSRASLLLARSYIERVLLLRKIAKQSADAASELGRSQFLSVQGDFVSPEDEIFDDDTVSQMLQKLDSTSEPHFSEEDDIFSSMGTDISGDDTAVHVIEAVPPKFVGLHLDENLLEKELKEIFFETFNHVNIEISWRKIDLKPQLLEAYDRQIDWCFSNGFSVTAGPILNFSPMYLPDFLQDCCGDFDAICEHVRGYVELLVKRYRSRVSTWVATSRVNSFFHLGLSLLQQLELTVRVVGWIREFQPTAEVLTCLDMPWGDNILPPPFGVEDEESKIYPTIVCADYLLRSKCKIAGFQLEFNVGYGTLATYDRPVLDWSKLIDRWSHFGVPLYLLIRVPSSCEFDRKALIPNPPIWNGWTLRGQALWVSNVVPVLLAKPNVYGVDWCVFRDYRPHDYPNAGLITSDGRVKKAQIILAEILKYFMADMD